MGQRSEFRSQKSEGQAKPTAINLSRTTLPSKTKRQLVLVLVVGGYVRQSIARNRSKSVKANDISAPRNDRSAPLIDPTPKINFLNTQNRKKLSSYKL